MKHGILSYQYFNKSVIYKEISFQDNKINSKLFIIDYI